MIDELCVIALLDLNTCCRYSLFWSISYQTVIFPFLIDKRAVRQLIRISVCMQLSVILRWNSLGNWDRLFCLRIHLSYKPKLIEGFQKFVHGKEPIYEVILTFMGHSRFPISMRYADYMLIYEWHSCMHLRSRSCICWSLIPTQAETSFAHQVNPLCLVPHVYLYAPQSLTSCVVSSFSRSVCSLLPGYPSLHEVTAYVLSSRSCLQLSLWTRCCVPLLCTSASKTFLFLIRVGASLCLQRCVSWMLQWPTTI